MQQESALGPQQNLVPDLSQGVNAIPAAPYSATYQPLSIHHTSSRPPLYPAHPAQSITRVQNHAIYIQGQGQRTRANPRTIPTRPPRIRTILSRIRPRLAIMARQIHVAVLALQTAGCCAGAAGDEVAVAGGVVEFRGVGAHAFSLLIFYYKEGGLWGWDGYHCGSSTG